MFVVPARRHVEVPLSEATEIRPLGEEVQRGAIKRECGRAVEGRAVDRGSKVDWRGPRIERGRARGNPDVLAADTADATGHVGRHEDLESVATNGRPRVTTRPGQLRDQHGRPEVALVADAGALVDVKVPRPSGPRAREDERGDPRRLVLEIRGAVIVEGTIHHATEALRTLPTEIVPLVLSPGDIQIGEPAEAWPVAVEVHAMPVGSERGGPGVAADAVDHWSQIHGRAPIGIAASALRDPDLLKLRDVGAVDASGPARRDVEAQPVLRDRRVIVVVRRIDHRAEVDRRGPGTIRGLVFSCRFGR